MKLLYNKVGILVLSYVLIGFSTPGPLIAKEPHPLRKDYLIRFEKLLSIKSPMRYAYRLIHIERTKSDTFKLRVVKEKNIGGLLLMRDRKALKSLGGSFYDDGNANLLRFGGNERPYVVTYTAGGQTILGIDGDHDDIAETAVGSISGDLYWVLHDTFGISSFLKCISASRGGILDATLNCSNPHLPETGVGQNDAGQIPGIGIGNQPPGIGKPDCSPKKPGPPTQVIRRSGWDEDGNFIAWSMTTRPDGTTRTVATNSLREGGFVRHTVERDSQGRITSRRQTSIDSDSRITSDINYTYTYDGSGRVKIHSRDRISGDENETEHEESVGITMSPKVAVTPEITGSFEDPRCKGQETAYRQGTIFGEHCRNEDGILDPIACIRQMSDFVFRFTGGRCMKVTGKNDTESIKCEDNKSLADCFNEAKSRSPLVSNECIQKAAREEDPGEGRRRTGAGRTDGRDLPGARVKIDTRYIDTTPMGALILAICSPMGCLGEPQTFK